MDLIEDRPASPSNSFKIVPEDTNSASVACSAAVCGLCHASLIVHEGSDGPSPLDGSRDGKDMQPHPEHNLTRIEAPSVSDIYDDVAVTKANAVSTNMRFIESRIGQSDPSIKAKVSDARVFDRFEVPNTPTQRSSQVVSKITASNIQDHLLEEGESLDDTSLVIEPPRLEKVTPTPTPSHVLCVVCRKQHVLSKDLDTVTW